ncbi:acylphosphatase [Deferribacterales bacterium Es71-Z0220]|uniref:acylphosphatase n=1 Tax=Deferrivibrio essentukiensis TaxID=2880922 RepID=UPI001F616F90|nr:acylphosphatase [Deferrivibrio essentukiensis]MCB4203944.1 acylphosphatase [Deferrivibrio essentukiensis]
MKYKRVLVKGIVQGVGFRAFIYRNALSLTSLKGYVRNLLDGSVEIVCRGDERDIEKIIDAAKKGPYGSRVDGVEITEIDLEEDYRDFSVRR